MSDLRNFIKNCIRECLNEQKILNEGWYHGTPDAREIEAEGGFTNKTMKVDYVKDPDGLINIQQQMNRAKKEGNEDLYRKLLNSVPDFKEYYTYKKPVFLTDKYSVAKTYADPQRAFDYQNSVQKVYEVDVNCNKIVKIVATGDRFRFISIDKVKQGFINSGVSEEEINKLISMFNYYISDNKGIKTDVIAAIGNWLDFDCIDVVGVLDSYHGGTVKSTVRMVLDPTNVKIKRV
jgi:hypothetical protein